MLAQRRSILTEEQQQQLLQKVPCASDSPIGVEPISIQTRRCDRNEANGALVICNCKLREFPSRRKFKFQRSVKSCTPLAALQPPFSFDAMTPIVR